MLSRRQIIRTALSSGIFLSLPISSLRSKRKPMLFGTGSALWRPAMTIAPTLLGFTQTSIPFTVIPTIKRGFDALTQQIQSKKPGSDVFDLIIPSAETSLQIEKLAEKGGPDVRWLVGVTSEADIASNYYEAEGKSLLIYEIQCYSIIFNIKFSSAKLVSDASVKFGWSDEGKIKNAQKIVSQRSRGRFGRRRRSPRSFCKLKKYFRTADNLSVRVTKVTPTKSMKNG